MVEFVFAAESMWAKLCLEHGVAAAIGGYVDGNARFGWGLIRFGTILIAKNPNTTTSCCDVLLQFSSDLDPMGFAIHIETPQM